jgi:salicylate hydroxylase
MLSTFFGRLTAWDQVPMMLNAYAELRQERCASVGAQEESNQTLVHLPPGPHRDARDEGFKGMLAAQHMEEWDEAQLRERWESVSVLLGYNAFEAAEDWWMKWGVIVEASKARTIGIDPVSMAIVSETQVTMVA